MTKATFQEKVTDFSLVMGGPIFQLFRKAHLTGDHLELLHRLGATFERQRRCTTLMAVAGAFRVAIKPFSSIVVSTATRPRLQ